GVQSMLQDRLGRLWISTVPGVGYLESDRFVPVAGVPGRLTRAIVEDRESVWVANQDAGLFRVTLDGRHVHQTSNPQLNLQAVSAAVADSKLTGVWVGFFQGGITHVVDDGVRATYSSRDGLAQGTVRHLRLDREGTLWVAADGGFSRVKDGRVITLTGRN